MKRHKILIVLGTRPELIKVAPIIQQLEQVKDIYDVRICGTGQHKELVDPLLDLFNIQFDYDLKLMNPSQSSHRFLSRCIDELGQLMGSVNPHYVMVQGDTNSALAGALAAYHANIPIIHIEAGLRSFDLGQPFPEEGNRRIISQLARFHFAPTDHAQQLLSQSGINEHVYVTGNTVIDSLFHTLNLIEPQKKAIFMRYKMQYQLDLSRRYILITTHRRESIHEKLSDIYHGILTLANQNPSMNFIIILHPNPNVQAEIKPFMNQASNCYFIEPLPYQDCCLFLNHCFAVMTDSGGIQEEAPSLNKPVLVLRDQTERQEGVDSGCLLKVGTQSSDIIHTGTRLIKDPHFYNQMAQSPNPFGDGKSSERIQHIMDKLLLGSPAHARAFS